MKDNGIQLLTAKEGSPLRGAAEGLALDRIGRSQCEHTVSSIQRSEDENVCAYAHTCARTPLTLPPRRAWDQQQLISSEHT